MNKSIQYLIGGAAVIIIIAGMKIGADLINPILVSFLMAICITPLPEWMARKGMKTNLALAITGAGIGDYYYAGQFCFRTIR
jgi:AI-2 transport protein TqsA